MSEPRKPRKASWRELPPTEMAAYTDSELVVGQVNGVSAVKHAHLQVLHEQACGLRREFKTFRIGWVPREWNLEADQLVRDALAAVP